MRTRFDLARSDYSTTVTPTRFAANRRRWSKVARLPSRLAAVSRTQQSGRGNPVRARSCASLHGCSTSISTVAKPSARKACRKGSTRFSRAAPTAVSAMVIGCACRALPMAPRRRMLLADSWWASAADMAAMSTLASRTTAWLTTARGPNPAASPRGIPRGSTIPGRRARSARARSEGFARWGFQRAVGHPPRRVDVPTRCGPRRASTPLRDRSLRRSHRSQ